LRTNIAKIKARQSGSIENIENFKNYEFSSIDFLFEQNKQSICHGEMDRIAGNCLKDALKKHKQIYIVKIGASKIQQRRLLPRPPPKLRFDKL
jgi:hypothetical protein